MTKSITGAKMVVQALVDQGVDVVFGYPGGAVLPIYDEIFQQNAIQHVLVRHEQGAVHAAEGYARSTGKPGVVLVTSGPGATNAVTGLTDALLDSIPIVVLTGQVPTFMIGSDAFQEADTIGISRHCTKHNYLVRDPKELASVIEEAFRIATTGRPGPVLIDIPKNVQVATAGTSAPAPAPINAGNRPTIAIPIARSGSKPIGVVDANINIAKPAASSDITVKASPDFCAIISRAMITNGTMAAKNITAMMVSSAIAPDHPLGPACQIHHWPAQHGHPRNKRDQPDPIAVLHRHPDQKRDAHRDQQIGALPQVVAGRDHRHDVGRQQPKRRANQRRCHHFGISGFSPRRRA